MSPGTGEVDALTTSVAQYSTAAFNTVKYLHTWVIVPIASVVAAIMCMLELSRQAQHVDGDQKLGAQVIAATMLKLVLFVIVIRNADEIIRLINNVGQDIIVKFNDKVEPIGDGKILNEVITTAVSNAGDLDRTVMVVVLFIPWIIALVGGLIVNVMVFLRFMELDMLSAFVTLPLSFFMHPDTKSIAIGFLKRYAIVVFQGATILLVVVLFNMSSGQINGVEPMGADQSLADWVMSNLDGFMLTPVAFIVLIFASGRIAKAIFGEG